MKVRCINKGSAGAYVENTWLTNGKIYFADQSPVNEDWYRVWCDDEGDTEDYKKSRFEVVED